MVILILNMINFENFKKDGYLNIGKVLTDEEINILKDLILEKLDYKDNKKEFKDSKNLLLENKNFFNLLVNPKILSTIRTLCDNKRISFNPHTDIHINLLELHKFLKYRLAFCSDPR